MPRIRSIKPEFWCDEEIASWPFESRLLYVALWNFADDEGRLRAHPGLIKSQLLPFDDLDIHETLAPIIESGKLMVYKANGQTFGWLPNFNANQVINRPKKSKLPPPPRNITDPSRTPDPPRGEREMTDHGVVTDDSVTSHGSNREAAVIVQNRSIHADSSDEPTDHGSITEESRIDHGGKERKGREGSVVRAREGTYARGPDPGFDEFDPFPGEPIERHLDDLTRMPEVETPLTGLALRLHERYVEACVQRGKSAVRRGAAIKPLARLCLWAHRNREESEQTEAVARRMLERSLTDEWTQGGRFLTSPGALWGGHTGWEEKLGRLEAESRGRPTLRVVGAPSLDQRVDYDDGSYRLHPDEKYAWVAIPGEMTEQPVIVPGLAGSGERYWRHAGNQQWEPVTFDEARALRDEYRSRKHA